MQEGGAPSHPTALLMCDASPCSSRADVASQCLCVNERRTDNDFTVLAVLTDKVSVTTEAVREPEEQPWLLDLNISSPSKSRRPWWRRHTDYFWALMTLLPAAFPSLCLRSFLSVALETPPIRQAPLSTKEQGERGVEDGAGGEI